MLNKPPYTPIPLPKPLIFKLLKAMILINIKLCIATLEYNIDLSRLKVIALEINNIISEDIIIFGKEMIRTSICFHTIFSKYFTLPMVTFPLILVNIKIDRRARPATIRHLLSRQESSLPIKLIAHIELNVNTVNRT